jgi:hypothetical protein
MVKGDQLREVLGHPVHQAGYAADQLDSAQAAYYKDAWPAHAKWEAAMAANDLDGAKAANKIEIDALVRYIDALDHIDWPPGTFAGQANSLRDHLSGLIEFDRRQVDVATVADIVQAPKEGTVDSRGAQDTESALWAGLVKNYQTADPGARC